MISIKKRKEGWGHSRDWPDRLEPPVVGFVVPLGADPDGALCMFQPTPPHMPQWVKNTANWWATGQVSDSEFIQSVQYLISEGVLKTS